VGRLIGPYKVVVLVLVGEVGAVHEQFGVLADLVCNRRVEVALRLPRLLVPLRHLLIRSIDESISHGARSSSSIGGFNSESGYDCSER
jgi:hypothetical protein